MSKTKEKNKGSFIFPQETIQEVEKDVQEKMRPFSTFFHDWIRRSARRCPNCSKKHKVTVSV